MNEILPGVLHWTTHHEKIGSPVHSAFLVDEGVLIDPRVPEAGIEAVGEAGTPREILLTNRHHYRHSGRFREAFGIPVRCHRAGMHEFDAGEEVEPFEFGDTFAGGVEALEVGALCPEETAFLAAREGGILALGDAVVPWGEELGFVPEEYIGDDPPAIKAAIRAAVGRLLERPLRHAVFAHGDPLVGDAHERLETFAAGAASR